MTRGRRGPGLGGMRERRTFVALGLALLQLVLAATVTLETADVAWAPSYFDGDDGDAWALPLSERLPALTGSASGLTPLPAARGGPTRAARSLAADRPRGRPLPRSTSRVAPSRFAPGRLAAHVVVESPPSRRSRMFGLGVQALMLILPRGGWTEVGVTSAAPGGANA